MRPYRPQKLLIAVDGPKPMESDQVKVQNTIAEFKKIDWTEDIDYLIREKNLGLRFAVPEAVSWVVKKYGEVIVLEDDVRVGEDFFDYMSSALDQYRHVSSVGHISAYNVVNLDRIANSDVRSRGSIYPESYAWATWERAWNYYSDDLSWIRRRSIKSLKDITGSWLSALIWKINFRDAHDGVISTWAYRWVASLWRNNLICVSPNRNLVRYQGVESGTHTLTTPIWSELPVRPIIMLIEPSILGLDKFADQYISARVFRATTIGLIRRLLESLGLRVINTIRRQVKP